MEVKIKDSEYIKQSRLQKQLILSLAERINDTDLLEADRYKLYESLPAYTKNIIERVD